MPEGVESLAVLWGGTSHPFSTNSTIKLVQFPQTNFKPANPEPYAAEGMRSQNAHAIVAVDWNGDSRVDLVMATGFVTINKSRELNFTPFDQKDRLLFSPVGLWHDRDGKVRILLPRFTSEGDSVVGYLDACRVGDIADCVTLSGKLPAQTSAAQRADIIVADFDGDGKDDIIATLAYRMSLKPLSPVAWFSSKGGTATVIDSVAMATGFLASDINRDGKVEWIFQSPESISDSPSSTSVFGFKGQTFAMLQRITNPGNHNDQSSLVDVNKDGFIDLLFSEVDGGMHVLTGSSRGFGSGGASIIGQWKSLKLPFGTGLHPIDLGEPDGARILVRSPAYKTGAGQLSVHPYKAFIAKVNLNLLIR